MERFRGTRLRCLGGYLGLAACVCIIWSQPGRAADWRLFGLSYLNGAAGYSYDCLTERTAESSALSRLSEETLQLSLGGYLFHPLFLTLDADTALAAFPHNTLGSARNRDSGFSFTLLSGKPLSAGGTGRAKVETVKQSFDTDYERKVDSLGGWALLRLGSSLAELHFTEERAQAAQAPTPEDSVARTLGADTTWQLPLLGTLKLNVEQVDRSDRAAGTAARYLSADLSANTSFLRDQAHVYTSAGVLRRVLPSTAVRYRVASSARVQHSRSLTSSHQVEVQHVEEEAVRYDLQRAETGLEKALDDHWLLGTALSAARSGTDQMQAETLRWSGRASFQRDLPGNFRLAGWNELFAEHVSSSGRVALRDESYDFVPLDTVQLRNTGVDRATIRVTNQTGTIVYREGTAYSVREVNGLVYLERNPNPDNKDDQDHIPAGATVLVSYECVLPGQKYTNYGNTLSARAGREFRPGVGVEVTAFVQASLPVVSEGPTGYAQQQLQHDLDLSGYLKGDGREVRGGVTLGSGRTVLHASGRLPWHGWELTENYRGTFYPDLAAHSLESAASYTLGLSQKNHVELVVTDRTYLANGRLDQALTSAGVSYQKLFTPLMRLDTNARYEANRVIQNDQRLCLGTAFSWEQGQLVLSAGYEYKVRLLDRFVSHHVRFGVKRWF